MFSPLSQPDTYSASLQAFAPQEKGGFPYLEPPWGWRSCLLVYEPILRSQHTAWWQTTATEERLYPMEDGGRVSNALRAPHRQRGYGLAAYRMYIPAPASYALPHPRMLLWEQKKVTSYLQGAVFLGQQNTWRYIYNKYCTVSSWHNVSNEWRT